MDDTIKKLADKLKIFSTDEINKILEQEESKKLMAILKQEFPNWSLLELHSQILAWYILKGKK